MIKSPDGKDYKIVICTPAGREKYLSIFKKHIYRKMQEGIVDGWQLWQNTLNDPDIAYIASMVAENPLVQSFTIPNLTDRYEKTDTFRTCEFFAYAQEDDTIYIRFDDDIVWCEENAIMKMAQARIDHPDAMLIYPNIINSTITVRMHQDCGALPELDGKKETGEYLDEHTYSDSRLIDIIHDAFKNHYETETLEAYYLPSHSFDSYRHFSICALAWWGKDHLKPSSLEEPSIAWEIPKEMNRPVYFLGDCLMMHYAYHTQRPYLESCNPQKLEFYKTLKEVQ